MGQQKAVVGTKKKKLIKKRLQTSRSLNKTTKQVSNNMQETYNISTETTTNTEILPPIVRAIHLHIYGWLQRVC